MSISENIAFMIKIQNDTQQSTIVLQSEPSYIFLPVNAMILKYVKYNTLFQGFLNFRFSSEISEKKQYHTAGGISFWLSHQIIDRV